LASLLRSSWSSPKALNPAETNKSWLLIKEIFDAEITM